eukprot:scpid13917/ scgid34494/ Protein smoothened; SMOH; Smooth; dSMO
MKTWGVYSFVTLLLLRLLLALSSYGPHVVHASLFEHKSHGRHEADPMVQEVDVDSLRQQVSPMVLQKKQQRQPGPLERLMAQPQESLQSFVEHTNVRFRRQASTGESTSQVILGIRKVLAPLLVSSVAQCTDLFTQLLSNCEAYVTRVLQEQLVIPLRALHSAYSYIAANCSNAALAFCPSVTCATLVPQVAMLDVVVTSTGTLVAGQTESICNESADTMEFASTTNTVVQTLASLLGGLSASVDIRGILTSAALPTRAGQACGGVFVMFGSQLSSLADNLLAVARVPGLLSTLQTNLPTLQVVQFEIPRRVFAAYQFLADAELGNRANAAYVNASISFLLCQNVFPSEGYQLCPWMCRNITELFRLADKFQLDNETSNAGEDSTVVALLRELGGSCVNDSSDWKLCSDIDCPPNALCVPAVNRTQRNDLTPAEVESSRAQERASGVCFLSKCPFPLHNTSVPQHWDTKVQNVLRAGFDATNSLLKEMNLTFRGDVLPCGMACNTFTFRDNDERIAKIVVGVFAWTLFVVNLFALISFYLNRERLNKYPTKVLLYLNLTSFISNLATLIQFVTQKKSFVCFDDDTLRMSEPYSTSDPGSRACTVIFILLFYFLLVSLFWWLALAHAWYITFERLDTKGLLPEDNDRYLYIYHIVAWTVPAILTGVMLGKHYIDGFPLIGVCFTNNVDSLFALLSIPIVVVGLLGLPFLLKGSLKLLLHKKHMNKMKNVRRPSSRAVRSHAGLRNFLVKLMIIMIMSFINLLVQFAVGLFMRVSWKQWRKEIEDHLECELTRCSADTQCPALPNPSVFPFLLIPVTIILEGLVLCFWAFTRDTWQTWRQTTQKPSQFFSRATSLITGNEKPTISNITAARKAARTLRAKASARHNNQTGLSASVAPSESYTDASAWDNSEMTEFPSVAPDRYVTSATSDPAIPASNPSDRKPANGKPAPEGQKSRVKISVDVTAMQPTVTEAPATASNGTGTRLELDEMRLSPGAKRREFRDAGRDTSRVVSELDLDGGEMANGGTYSSLQESPGARRRNVGLGDAESNISELAVTPETEGCPSRTSLQLNPSATSSKSPVPSQTYSLQIAYEESQMRGRAELALHSTEV